MTTQFKIKRASETVFIILIAVCCGAILAPVHAQKPEAIKAKSQYQVSDLPGLGGTSNGGNSINDQTWVSGYARLPNRNRHAALWRNSSLTDLFTLGGPNSSVTWNVKNTAGIIVGISQTADAGTPRREHGVAQVSTVRLTTSAISISGSFGKTTR